MRLRDRACGSAPANRGQMARLLHLARLLHHHHCRRRHCRRYRPRHRHAAAVASMGCSREAPRAPRPTGAYERRVIFEGASAHATSPPSPPSSPPQSPSPPLAIAIIPSSPAIVSRHHHPVITIPSSPSCHHHPVVTTTAPPAEPTCWGLTPEPLRPDATFILKLIVTEQTSAQ